MGPVYTNVYTKNHNQNIQKNHNYGIYKKIITMEYTKNPNQNLYQFTLTN